MKIFDKFEIVEPYPALYFDNTVVIGDLHLGLESLMVSEGVFFPKFQLDEIKDHLKDIFDKKDPERIVIVGDLKHEFSETTYGESEEVKDLLNFLEKELEEIRLIKGNHDNYLIYPTKEFEKVHLDQSFTLNKTRFIHGHQEEIDISKYEEEAKYWVIGHEHPALSLKDDVGIKEKIPCFLYGELNLDQSEENNKDEEGKIVVLPAFSRLAEGSQVNEIPDNKLMSPILKKYTDLDQLTAIGITKETGVLKFTKLGKL